ncbi:MAG: NUDIX hydrolase [Clostridia bacterium]|nr:NUDIX hydrolase [Clostridia bacterium]
MPEMLDARGLTEAEAIERYRKSEYPRPGFTADVVMFARDPEGLWLLLIRRGGHPFLGKLALPGGFAEMGETIEQTAARELEEETGVTGIAPRLLGVYSRPGRDPRGWTVSAAYWTVVDRARVKARAGDDAADAGWYRLEREGSRIFFAKDGEREALEDMAFDHADIVSDALCRLEEEDGR